MKIKISGDQREIRWGIEPSPTQSATIARLPASRCVNHSTQDAKQILISKLFEHFSKEPEINDVALEEGTEAQFKITIDHPTKLSPFVNYRFGRIIEKAFPQFWSYFPLKKLGENEFAAMLESDQPNDELVRLARTVAPPQEDAITVGKILDFFKLQRSDQEMAPEVFEFFKRLSGEELLSLGKKLLSLEKKPHFAFSNFQDPIFQQEDWPYLALLAFLRGEINTMALAQLLLYDECVRTHPTRIYNVMDSNAIDLLCESLNSLLDKEYQTTLKRRLMELPPSDSYFFSIPIPSQEDKMGQQLNAAREEPLWKTFLIHHPEHLVLIVPPRIVWEILQVKFGNLAMKPNPVLGYSRPEDFAFVDRRDVGIPCRLTRCPPAFSPLSLYHHDSAFHLFVDSANCHREAWIELAKSIKGMPDLRDIHPDLLDRDFVFYIYQGVNSVYEQALMNPSEIFWGSLVRFLVIYLFTQDSKDRFLTIVTKHIMQHRDEWQHKYGISIQDLYGLKPIGEMMTDAHTLLMNKLRP